MVLHAALSSEDVFVVASDTDVLILMIYAYSEYMVKQRWDFRCENEKCADIEIISSYLSKRYAQTLLIYSFILTSGEVHI